MSAENELMKQVARQLEHEAPPISVDEIEQRALTASATLDIAEPPSSSRRWAPIMLAVAAAALVTGGIALALTERSPAPTLRTSGTVAPGTIAPPTEPTTAAPTTVASATTVAEAETTGSAPSTVAVERSSISIEGDPAAAVAAIDADRMSKLRTLEGFIATVRQTTETLGDDGEPIDSQPGFNSRTTLLTDGSMWTEIEGGGFASYDATTGESRGAIVMPSGDMYYQLIEGWTDNSTGMSIMLGSDPARPLSETTQYSVVVVRETTHDQRPAWQIESTMNAEAAPVDPDLATQTETFVVDQATGLIVVSSIEWQGTPQERVRRSSELIDIELVSEMPAGFPGEFPEGAQIDRSGDPNAFRPATLDEAAAWFGPGFFAPADVPAGTTIFLSEYEWESDNPESALNKSVQITAREGFATPWSIFLSKDEPGPGGATPDGQLLIDGNLCRDFDQDGTCDVLAGDAQPLDNPAFADFWLSGEPPTLVLERNGLRIAITGSSLVDARSIAETLVAR